MTTNIITLIVFYPVFLLSLSLHEAAHAWMANRLGDDTAGRMGRITLNPVPHMDILGTVILPIIGILTPLPILGWGKPVPVNPYRLNHPIRRSSLWVAVAGPLSNICLAIICAISLKISIFPNIVYSFLFQGMVLNLVLATFNLIPLSPLDGATVLRGVLPEFMLYKYDLFSKYSSMILMGLFMLGWLKYLLLPVYWLANLLLSI